MNQTQIVKQRRKINLLLASVAAGLFYWVALEVHKEFKRTHQQIAPLTAQKIELIRENDTITLENKQNVWRVTQPYQSKASQVVMDTLLSLLQNGCRTLESPPSREPQQYAKINLDKTNYHVGELNQASDEVYIKHGEQWLLCDKLIASMALAPAINFIDKQLYEGELTTIVGDFGRLTDFTGMDLSVMEVAPADANALPKNAIATLTFEAEDKRSYQTFLSDNSKHLLLYDKEKSLIYVIIANQKLNAVLGL